MTTFAHPSTSHHPQGEEAAAAWLAKEEAEQARLAGVWAKAPAKVGEGRGSTHTWVGDGEGGRPGRQDVG